MFSYWCSPKLVYFADAKLSADAGGNRLPLLGLCHYIKAKPMKRLYNEV
jgi:hypothetical protein